MGSTDERSQL